MMYDVGEDVREAVVQGITDACVPSHVSKQRPCGTKLRRKILDVHMKGIGSWIELDFSEIKPEGLPCWDAARGEFFTKSRRDEMMRENREKQQDFYRKLEQDMHRFQSQLSRLMDIE